MPPEIETSATPSDPLPRNPVALGLAVVALLTSTLGSCLAFSGAGFTTLVAQQGGANQLDVLVPFIALFVVASLVSVGAVWVARDRTRTGEPIVIALPLASVALTLAAYAVPCLFVTVAQRGELARAHEGLRVDDISAIGRPCDFVADAPRGTCPERYLCIASGDAPGGSGDAPGGVSEPRCQISCMGNPEFCGAGSHCVGAFCVLDR